MVQHADRHDQPDPAHHGGQTAPGIALIEDPALLAELMVADPADLTAGERAEAVLALAKLRGQVEAALSRSVAAFDANVDFAADGARSTATWIAARTELSRSEAKSFEHQARDLRSCPVVEDAYRSGVLGSAKVRALLRTKEGVATLFSEQETESHEGTALVTLGRHCVGRDQDHHQ